MKISFDELKARNILSKGQMQNVRGGSGTCNISKEEALFSVGEGGEGMNWCCDSCKDTWYCGKN